MKNSFMVMLLLWAFSGHSAWAGCSFTSASSLQQGITVTIPLLIGNITAGPEVPNGTVLYRQSYKPSFSGVSVSCTEKVYEQHFDYTSNPLPLSNWSGNPYGGKVYESGIPGVGIVYWRANNGFPYVSGGGCSGGANCNWPWGNLTWDVSLIKIGNISTGAITGSNMPCMQESVGSPGSQLSVIKACFSGSLNVVSRTCTTPDVHVDMKKYNVKKFTGKGSTTQWENASIRLENCPVFYGTVNDGQNNTWSDNGQGTAGNSSENNLGLVLTPNTSIIDPINGVISLSTSETSASGVGIQLAYGSNDIQSMVNFSQEKKYKMALGSSGSVQIPIVARYIQTDDRVSPGQANSAVTFIINYY